MANKLILGTVQFGLEYGINNRFGKPKEEEVSKILKLAYEEKIHLLDTAEAYGNSQEVIGNYHRANADRFEIITKFSAGRADLSKDIKERVLQNLKTLQVNSLYGYMFHSFTDFEKYYPVYKNDIKQLKSDGLIKKFGVSIYTNSEFEKVLNVDGINLIQLPFNLLDNNFQRAHLISQAKSKGIEIHTRSAFLQGLFFKDADQLSGNLVSLKSYLNRIKIIAQQIHSDLKTLALNYCVAQKNIDFVLIGVDVVGQLTENIASINQSVDSSVYDQIDTLQVMETDMLNPSNWRP